MGNNNFKLTKLALALGLTASLTACFSDNDDNKYEKPPVTPPETVVVAVPPAAVEVQAGSLTLNLVDVTGAEIEAEATVSFTSAEDGLLTISGNALADTDKVTSGSSFAFTVGSIPADGVSYDYVVTAEGYLSNSGSITLTSSENVAAQEIRLTPRTLADSDVAIVAETKDLSELAEEGTTVAYDPASGLSVSGDKTEIQLKQAISADKAAKAVGSTTVKIKSGTQFLDKDGTALTSAPKMTVAYFANEATRNDNEAEEAAAETSSLDAFPGGLALSVATDPNSTEQSEGSFTSGGFVAIELVDDEGNKVSTFGEGNSITVAMEVDKKTSNPCPVTLPAGSDVNTYAEANGFKNGICTVDAPVSRKLAAGDIFPVWSYDEDAGKWEFESYGEITFNDADPKDGTYTTFDVAVDVNHLSYWNLDFFNNSSCSSVSFDILDSNDVANVAETRILLETNGYRRLLTSYTGDYSEANIARPPSFPITVKVLRNGVNVLDGLSTSSDGAASGLKVDNLCDLNGQDLKLTIAPPTIVSKQITTQLVCSNTEDFEVATAPVPTPSSVRLFKGTQFQQTIYSTGTFTVNLEEGSTYSARYQDVSTGQWLPRVAVTADSVAATFDIPTVCEVEEVEATGSGSGS
ncbi:hypothetical protein C7Y70_01220 [Pseudoalteromonas sp. KS88]|uniref:hypothetical protein n=1 Tax=Pseudoalteromonas sp. KS88 TaxID=2109918 RepID=UPI0010820213|nr:hypothetical protein [Pseudoalteromonas sp. KS88]TGE85363.1 hypothetical protein C7Y70_01220 [Pseudoalteromonas sp. KS88]